jgi:iron complex outermembrane receptor protein
MGMKRIIAVLVLVGCAFITQGAFAAEGNKSQAGSCVKLDTIVVTPSRYDGSILDSDKSISVISEDDIKRYEPRTVPELLQGETGVIVRDFIGNGKTATVDMRGFGEAAPMNTLVMINGRRTNQIDLSGPDWSQINPESIERIEIVRGPQTVLYGDNAVGGVINIITKKGTGKKPEIGIGGKLGTYDYRSYNAEVSGGSDFLDYYAGFSQSDTDGYRVNNRLQLIDLNTSMILKPTRYLDLKFEGGYHKDWYGQPGGLTPADIGTLGIGGSSSPNDRAKTQDWFITAGPEVRVESGIGDFVFSGDSIVRIRRTASVNFYSGGSIERDGKINTFGLIPKVVYTTDIFGCTNKLISGIDYYSYKDSISNGTFPTKDIIIIQERTLGLYATDTLDLTEKFSLTGGGRLENARYHFDQQLMIPGTSNKRDWEYALEAGTNYKVLKHSALYANYARSFRFPAVDEWYTSQYVSFGALIAGGLNTDLEPQTGNHYEIGIKDNSIKYMTTTADFYLDDIKHELYYDPTLFTNSIYDRTMHHGFEVEEHIRPVDNLDIFGKYTYQKAFFVGSHYAGDEIPGVPRDKISAGVNYTFMDCFTIAYLANFIGKQRFISDQKNIVPPLKSYTTHDLKLSYIKYGLEMFIGIYNLLDEKYSAYGITNGAGSNQAVYPSPGRNVTLGANYKF